MNNCYIVQIELYVKTLKNTIKTYYILNEENFKRFADWYDDLSCFLYNDIMYEKHDINYNVIFKETERNEIYSFLKKFGNSFELLEYIEELSDIFISRELLNSNDSDSDNDSLMERTETVIGVINNHNNNEKHINLLLKELNIEDTENDYIIKNIITKELES